jgi:hypothetical protein
LTLISAPPTQPATFNFKQWTDTLSPGIAIVEWRPENGWGRLTPYIVPVTDVTPMLIKTCSTRQYSRATGLEPVLSGTPRGHIVPLTDELKNYVLELHEKRTLVTWLRQFKFDTLDLDTLRELYEQLGDGVTEIKSL